MTRNRVTRLRRPWPIGPILVSLWGLLLIAAPVLDALAHKWGWFSSGAVCAGVWWAWIAPSSIRTYRARLRSHRRFVEFIRRFEEAVRSPLPQIPLPQGPVAEQRPGFGAN